jgi:hypothetical protein
MMVDGINVKSEQSLFSYGEDSLMKLMFRLGSLEVITLWRVREQMKATAPDWVSFTKDEREADAQIILAIGASGVANLVDLMPTILLQLCYKTSEMPAEWWSKIWDKCMLIGSYYDLNAPNFVRFPMGYDPKLFYRDTGVPKRYDAIVFGELDGTEEIKSVIRAFDVVAHIGSDMGMGPGCINYHNIPDERLRLIYAQSKYCIGMRHIEGFEMPIIEGAACGCRPIALDLECYRHWFEDLPALFIDPNCDVEEQLRHINGLDLGQVPTAESIKRFEQSNAWKPFWEALECQK